MLRRALICLAFATWCFLNFWVALGERRTVYFLRQNPVRATLPGVIGWELILTLAMWVAWEIGRKRPRRRSMDLLFLFACLLPLGIGTTALARIAPFDFTAWIQAGWFWPVAIAAGTMAFSIAATRSAQVGRWLRSMFLWSWLMLSVVFVHAALNMLRYPAADYRDLPLAPRLLTPPPEIRVVWIIFDELSQTVGFTNRPRGLALPNFDRMRAESFYATAALAPADATLLSMPSLILGERVVRAEPDGPAGLLLQTRAADGWFSWSFRNNVFDSARQAGFNTALAGWYHPYGRLLYRSLTECFWTPTEIEPGVEEGSPSPISAMRDRLWLQIANLPLAGHLSFFSPRRYEQRTRIPDFLQLRQFALQWAADSNIGLLLLHLPVPHPPGIYNSATSQIGSSGTAGYLDNVALADRTLGDLRRSMEQAGVWNRTAVIVSADHGWRIGLWRALPEWTRQEERFAPVNTSGVPFLVKMPNQSEPVTYEKPFDTVVTRKILTAVLKRDVTNARQIASVIEGAGETR